MGEFEDDVGDVEIKNILMQNEKKYSRCFLQV